MRGGRVGRKRDGDFGAALQQHGGAERAAAGGHELVGDEAAGLGAGDGELIGEEAVEALDPVGHDAKHDGHGSAA